MEYYAHSIKDADKSLWQPLHQHLHNTAVLAADMALPEYKSSIYLIGLVHDLGKYQKSFQSRLEGKNIKVDHALCGAKEIGVLFDEKSKCIGEVGFPIKFPMMLQDFARLCQYCVIGHHSGLPNIGVRGENIDPSCLYERLKKDCEDYSDYKNELGSVDIMPTINEILQFLRSCGRRPSNEDIEFLVRYLYSCLVDADFLDTERFVNKQSREKYEPDWQDLNTCLEGKFSSFVAKTPVQKARSRLKSQAIKNAGTDHPIYLLDMPTGSGKTLCALSLALLRLMAGGKKRIIYVIPYTSIIEQTAQEIKSIFKEKVKVLEHHSNFDFDETVEDDITVNEKLKKSAENWDIPIIITTSVQFYESIYSNRSSRLRKLHNMADSVLIFDEIHTLPLKNFEPCMKAIDQLTKHYRSEAILLTATMPDFPHLASEYINRDMSMFDLISDKSDYDIFRKCKYAYLGKVDPVLDETKSHLVVVNKKKTALKYYREFDGKNKKYYLSTYMTAVHRLRVINEIKGALAAGKKIAVFSTSLVEAGVDFDFETVWRELAGLDNILQAGGRCNREGKRSKQDSLVNVFETDDKLIGDMGIRASICKSVIDNHGIDDIDSKVCTTEYFNRLFAYNENKFLTKGKEKRPFDIDFKDKAEKFKMIDESVTESVVIPCNEINAEIQRLRDTGMINHRKIQRYCASVSKNELKDLLETGSVEEHNGVFVLADETLYDPDTGLDTQRGTGFDIIV